MFSGAMLIMKADQVAANYSGAGAVVPWDGPHHDFGNWFDPSVSPHGLVVPGGVDFVIASASLRVDLIQSQDYVGISLLKNGSPTFVGATQQVAQLSAGGFGISFVSREVPVEKGDILEVLLFTKTDPSITVVAARSGFSVREL